MHDPNTLHPVRLSSDGSVWPFTTYLKNVIDHPNIEVGDFTYYNDFDGPEDIQRTLFPYMFPGAPEIVVIGKFGQIAHGTQFITSSANHQMDGFSTYPFTVFGEPWAKHYEPRWPEPKDTIVGHDVWCGHQSCIMPGVNIGNGAIIATRSVVTKDVPDYAIVGGNPAKVIRMRFDDETIKALNEIAWWDWPVEKITEYLAAITSADIDALA